MSLRFTSERSEFANHLEEGSVQDDNGADSATATDNGQGQLMLIVHRQSRGMFNVSNVQFSHQEALLYVFEDNEAVIKMFIIGRSPTLRHVSRTHRVALDWLFD